MSIEFLKNIFEPGKTTTGYCRVVRRVLATKYEVEDATGRLKFAESTEFYPAGVSVIIQGGRIVGRGSAAGKHKTYEV